MVQYGTVRYITVHDVAIFWPRAITGTKNFLLSDIKEQASDCLHQILQLRADHGRRKKGGKEALAPHFPGMGGGRGQVSAPPVAWAHTCLKIPLSLPTEVHSTDC